MRRRSSCSRKAHTRERLADLRASVESGPRIEQREVLRGIEKLLMFVLAVQLNEAIRQILECGGGGECAGDEGARAALRGDLAPHDQLDFAAVLRFENGFDGGDVFAGANQVWGRASAEQ